MKSLTRVLIGLLVILLLAMPASLDHRPAPAPAPKVHKQHVDQTLEHVNSYITPRLRGIGGRSPPPTVGRAVSEALVSAARAAGFDPLFVMAVVEAESKWNIEAISPTGSRGLMQLQPATFLSVSKSYSALDPVANVKAGVAYLATLYRMGFVSADGLLRAYSDGPGASRQYNEAVRSGEDLSDFSPQARNYPAGVMSRYRRILKLHGVIHKSSEKGWRLK